MELKNDPVAWAFVGALGLFVVGTGVMVLIVYNWSTTGAEWFTILGYTFHKVSFAVGAAVGAIFLGGSGGVSSNARR